MIKKHLLFFVVPIFVILNHFIFHRDFLYLNWFVYMIGLLLLWYSYKTYLNEKNDNTLESSYTPYRKLYFNYVYFFILFLYPRLYKYNLFNAGNGIFGLNTTMTNCLIIFGVTLILYILIISDFRINELSIGNTKISMLKKIYRKQVDSHINNTNILLEKILAENKILRNSRKYCTAVAERFRSSEELDINTEYKNLLKRYYEFQNDNIVVFILDKLIKEEVMKDYDLKNNEFELLEEAMNKDSEAYTFKKSNDYYLFMPYVYRFEKETDSKTYIVLKSKKEIIVEEGYIINNILTKFTDDLAEQISDLLSIK